MNKKIIIFTASFGAGHNSVAKAIKKQLEESKNNYEVYIYDFMDITNPLFNKPLVKHYEFQTKYLPIVYNTYYYSRKHINLNFNIPNIIQLKKLDNFISSANADLIISTFPHASGAVNDVKRYFKCNIPLITVITDVVDSYEWIHKYTDLYFVPSQSIKEKLINKNILASNIKVTGVPVDSSFFNKNKNIIPTKKKILLMGGGRGLFDVSEKFFYWFDNFIDEHQDKIEATIVTGTNKDLYNKLANKKPLSNIHVKGFVNNMPLVLKEHDLLITKAGGATLFESINSGIPVIIKKPNVGQEVENAKFIGKENVGLIYNNEKELKSILFSLVTESNDKDLDLIIENIYDFKKEIYPENIENYIREII